MNFAQLHEALRLEILRRIDRGVLTGTLLARQTGFNQAHISNFLHRRRLLSLKAVDKVLFAQRLTVADLMPDKSARKTAPNLTSNAPGNRLPDTVPLVSQSSAIHDPHIAAHDVIADVPLPPGTLDALSSRRATSRRDWQRFVAIRITALQADPMKPVLSAHTIILIDRHYRSLTSYHPGVPTLYAVVFENTLMIRYVEQKGNILVLRPYDVNHLTDLLTLAPGQSASDVIIGRACLIIAEV